jgi:hypothetical protein
VLCGIVLCLGTDPATARSPDIVLQSVSGQEEPPMGVSRLLADTDGVQVWSDGRGGILVRTDASLLAPAWLTRRQETGRAVYAMPYFPRRLFLLRGGHLLVVDLPGGVVYVPPYIMPAGGTAIPDSAPLVPGNRRLDLDVPPGPLPIPQLLPSVQSPRPSKMDDLSVPPGLLPTPAPRAAAQ